MSDQIVDWTWTGGSDTYEMPTLYVTQDETEALEIAETVGGQIRRHTDGLVITNGLGSMIRRDVDAGLILEARKRVAWRKGKDPYQ